MGFFKKQTEVIQVMLHLTGSVSSQKLSLSYFLCRKECENYEETTDMLN